ncbi:MAG TPA: hypothetical protein VGG97_13505, partial [Bryobacteraceae bacterium]
MPWPPPQRPSQFSDLLRTYCGSQFVENQKSAFLAARADLTLRAYAAWTASLTGAGGHEPQSGVSQF